MRNFNRVDRGRDRRGGFNRGDNNREKPEMFKVICDKCGANCEVPFKPSSDKPIYCNDCFREKNQSSDRAGGKNFGRNNSRNREMFKTVCDECGANCEVPFKPSSDKPILCSICFEKQGGGRDRNRRTNSGNNGNIEEQLRSINSKLDEILKSFLMSSIKNKDIKEKVITKTKSTPKTKKKVENKKTISKKVKKSKK